MADFQWEDFEEAPQGASQGEPQQAKGASDFQWEDFEEAPKQSILGKTADVAQKYVIDPVEKARLPEIAGGVLQGSGDVARSVVNLPLEALDQLAGTKTAIPSFDLSQYGRQDPISKAAFMGGEIGGSVAPAAKAFEAIEGLTGAGGLGRRALTGALTGFATGEQGEQEGGRAIGTTVGGALPVIASGTSKSLAKRLTRAKEQTQKKYNQLYDNIFDELKEKGLHNDTMRVPDILKSPKYGDQRASIKTSGPREFTRSLDAFEKNPTFENAHDAQSDLGKLSRYLDSQSATRARQGKEVSRSKGKASDLAEMLQKRIRGSMQNFLMENESPHLVDAYSKATQGYKNEMVPYFHHAISKHNQGKIDAKRMLQQLTRSDDFMASPAAKQLAGLGLRQAAASKPVQIAGALTGAPVLYQLGMPELARLFGKAQDASK